MLQVEIYDLRQLDQPLSVENSNLNFNLRCIRCLREEEGISFATSLSRLRRWLHRGQSERSFLSRNACTLQLLHLSVDLQIILL